MRSMVSNRRRWGAWLPLVAVALCPPSSAGAQEAGVPTETAGQVAATDAAIEATLLRTWTADDLTIVDGLAQVPLGMLAGGTTGAYRFELTVFDSESTQLYRDTWERSLSNRAAAYTEAASSTMLEPFRFGVRPGAYEVEIRAYPTDAPDLGTHARLPVVAYAERPVASDLFLADRVEPLDDDGGGSWSITHGGFGIAAVARATVLPQEPRLYYYIELYGDPEAETEVELKASVVDGSGRVLYTTPATTEQVTVGGLPFAGSLSLAGLPPGAYDLRIELTGDGDEAATTRQAPFRMLDAESARPVTPASYESRYFASLSDEELASTFDGVGYMVSESERQAYQSLPPDAKRRYLTEFFASRNPTMDGMGNAFLEEYLERVGTVRMKYGELVGTGERAPWTTDAGRIYLRFGEPSERVINHFPSGADTRSTGVGSLQGEAPYEIWSYHSTGYVYLFVQESSFNVWRMIYTTDPNLRSLADWYERVGGQAIRDMQTQFGIQPRF